jgi:hypothetical protein
MQKLVPIMKIIFNILYLVIMVVEYHQVNEIHINRPATVVRDDISAYYEKKYPSDEPINEDAVFKYFGEHDTDPVSGMVHSNPYGPFQTIFENTEKSKTEITRTRLDFYSENDGKSCKIIISSATLEKAEDLPYSILAPITENDILSLSNASEAKGKTGYKGNSEKLRGCNNIASSDWIQKPPCITYKMPKNKSTMPFHRILERRRNR